MLFNSAIFIFAFLPIVLAGAYVLSRLKNNLYLHLWLLVASSFFYGWHDPKFLPLLAASIALNYIVGMKLAAAPRRGLLALGVGANLLALGYFKYAGFLVLNANWMLGTEFSLPAILQPLAISFITFQQIAFLADCYKGRVKTQPGFLEFSVFVTFFPKMAQGPIVRYEELMPQLDRQQAIRLGMIAAGLCLFTLGLFKKVFIADSLDLYATPLFEAAKTRPLEAVEAWVGMLSYTFQIYFDFSGYSDMAMGCAKMFGIRLPLNFFSPYKATSIIDFWRRWHMTLSRFLRDYLYISLGGNRKGEARRYTNLMITMLLGGLWHGASWAFVIWGALHGAFLVINHLWNKMSRIRMPAVVARTTTFLCVAIAWIFFRAADEGVAASIAKSLVDIGSFNFYEAFFTDASPLRKIFTAQKANLALPLIAVCAIICFFMPNTAEIMRKGKVYFGHRHGLARKRNGLIWQPSFKWGLALGVMIGLCLLKVLYEPSNVFLYFQF